MAEQETLVNQAMIDARDQWSDPVAAPPVSLSDIRKWAIAVYWPDTPPRVYWDEDYAKTTKYGEIIAPQDFNPFAWPVEQSARAPRPTEGIGTQAMNGGQVDTFGVPQRPGDVVSTTTALVDWNERTTRLGLTLFAVTEVRWTNQKGELVKSRQSTSILF